MGGRLMGLIDLGDGEELDWDDSDAVTEAAWAALEHECPVIDPELIAAVRAAETAHQVNAKAAMARKAYGITPEELRGLYDLRLATLRLLDAIDPKE